MQRTIRYPSRKERPYITENKQKGTQKETL